jgi:phosphatidate cytidylyltransferase
LKELLLRTITGITLIILVLGSMLLGPVPFLGILVVVYLLALRELCTLFKAKLTFPLGLTSISAGLIIPLTFMILQLQWSPIWYIVPLAGWILGTLWSGFPYIDRLILFWLAIPLSAFYALGWPEAEQTTYQSLIPVILIALVWINDTFAFVVGRLMGKHKMTPVLSPGKTWEGFAGGIIFTFLGGWILYRMTGQLELGLWLSISFIVPSLGLSGDLFESHLKRKKSVKNMGGLLPGHGGVLDRFDSLLFVAPAVYILLLINNLVR